MDEIKEALGRGAWTHAEAAAVCGVDIKTFGRWMKAAHRMPTAARRLLLILTGFDLGEVHPSWRGWRMNRRGELSTPENDVFTAGDVRALPYTYALRDELLSRTRLQEAEITQLKSESAARATKPQTGRLVVLRVLAYEEELPANAPHQQPHQQHRDSSNTGNGKVIGLRPLADPLKHSALGVPNFNADFQQIRERR